MNIGIDLDDVIFDCNGALTQFHNRAYGTSISRDDIVSFDLDQIWNCTREEVLKRLDEFYDSEEYSNALPVDGAIEAVRRLAEAHDVCIITARPDETSTHTHAWLRKYFAEHVPRVHFANLVQTDRARRRPKGDICRELGIDLFIEDAPEYAASVADAGVPVLIMDTPWNQGFEHPLAQRVHSWADILRILDDIRPGAEKERVLR